MKWLDRAGGRYFHVAEICRSLGIQVWRSQKAEKGLRSPCPKQALATYGVAGTLFDGAPAIALSGSGSGEISYIVALHEIGHHAMGSRRKRTIAGELIAWLWAVEHAEEWTPVMARTMVACLQSHVQRDRYGHE